MKTVAIQGVAGSFHDIAVRNFFKEQEIKLVPCDSFKELFAVIKKDNSIIGAVAIENTIAGSLLPNHTLLRESGFKIVGEYKLRIEHQLVAMPGQTIKDIENIKMGAGVLAMQGPGISIVIDDSKKQSKTGENLNLYLIHDDDILKVINELRAAGAEGISINEQRLIATSEIRCAGPTLSVNNTRYSPPYEIKAIGDSQTLENALKMRGGVVETLQFWGIQITIKTENNVILPAYKSQFRFEHSKPIKEGGQ